MTAPVTVLKIGGSILSGPLAYHRAAAYIGTRLCASPGERIVVVVSAELGATDELLATAREIVDAPAASTLDLLWSTGEIRSAALLTLALQALGVAVAATNVHEAGLVALGPGGPRLNPLRLRALLGEQDVIVVPGFFARAAGDAVQSLGRGGSDLSAVLLAAGLEAHTCELLKDVPGVFTRDPKKDPDARLIRSLSFPDALAMADEGCELVQRQALEAAARHDLPLVIRAIGHPAGTRIHGTPHDI